MEFNEDMAGAVYAFMGWLTTREKESGPFSGSTGAYEAAELCRAFLKAQGFNGDPRIPQWYTPEEKCKTCRVCGGKQILSCVNGPNRPCPDCKKEEPKKYSKEWYAEIDESKLIGNFDAQVWAEEFSKIFPDIDKDTMRGWFANAIMAGYDYAKNEKCSEEPKTDPDVIIRDLLDALWYTREYVGENLLPRYPMWSWFAASNRARNYLGMDLIPEQEETLRGMPVDVEKQPVTPFEDEPATESYFDIEKRVLDLELRMSSDIPYIKGWMQGAAKTVAARLDSIEARLLNLECKEDK